MMPKVKLKAPAGVGGQIHASRTQSVYTIGSDGTVVVEAADAADLIGAGYTTVPSVGGPDTDLAAPITSDSTTADIEGATALDPVARELGTTAAANAEEQPDNSADFGAAQPPHVVDKGEPTSAAEVRHDDAEEALKQQVDDLSPSAKPVADDGGNAQADKSPPPAEPAPKT